MTQPTFYFFHLVQSFVSQVIGYYVNPKVKTIAKVKFRIGLYKNQSTEGGLENIRVPCACLSSLQQHILLAVEGKETDRRIRRNRHFKASILVENHLGLWDIIAIYGY